MTRNIHLTLKSCKHIPTNAEARQLARDYKAGDQSAREALITGNLPMVSRMVRVMHLHPRIRDDAFEEGVIGLMMAVEKYDPDHVSQACFHTVAWYWVRQAIQAMIKRETRRFTHEEPAGININLTIDEFEPDPSHSITDGVPVETLVNALSDRERKALENITCGLRLEDLAAEMCISRERVRQIKKKALDKLRGKLK